MKQFAFLYPRAGVSVFQAKLVLISHKCGDRDQVCTSTSIRLRKGI